MPVIEVDLGELIQLSGISKSREWFIERIPMLGASFEGSEGNVLRFEFFPNRPDHYSVEGVARSLKTLYTDSRLKYVVGRSNRLVYIEESVLDVRPVFVGAIVEGVPLRKRVIDSIIELQEKLHTTVGRRREKVAIGIHDISAIRFPLHYTATSDDTFSFVPLGSERSMNIYEILELHEKGKEYGALLNNGLYPLLRDADGNVLSMPPIINGTLTALHEGSERLFIDVTGMEERACSVVLNILSAALADRGCVISSVTVVRGDERKETPNMEWRSTRLSPSEVGRLMGFKLQISQIAELLTKMGHRAEVDGDGLKVAYPPFRIDIMHPVDLIEDVAIAYGFEKFGASMPHSQTNGGLLPSTILEERVTETMIGYGYSQVLTFMISGKGLEFLRGMQPEVQTVQIRNPVPEEMDILRTSLLTSMLVLLETNKHNELPQRIFEIGDVHRPRREKHFAAISMHAKASFAEAKSLAEALVRDLRLNAAFTPSDDPRFISGRSMNIVINGNTAGVFGELHPQLITNFNLNAPIAALEVDIDFNGMLR
ncbi:MAG: phenylalanine--tRNA ligase subunit beta [Methanomassiliicoccales archaeon]